MLKAPSQFVAEKIEMLYTGDPVPCQASSSFSHTVEMITMHRKNETRVQSGKRGTARNEVSSIPTLKQFSRLHGKRFESASCSRSSRHQKRLELEQDIEKLKKKLRYEENVHRALERAFTRPLGALPRLPPYLSLKTLELLAEVAVLEEEVVRLEEQIVILRQGLYYEALYSLSSRKQVSSLETFEHSAINRTELLNPSCVQLFQENGNSKRYTIAGDWLPTVNEHSFYACREWSVGTRRRTMSGSDSDSANSCFVTDALETKRFLSKKFVEHGLKQQRKAVNSGSCEVGHGKENQEDGITTKTSNPFHRFPKPRILSKALPSSVKSKGTKIQLPLKAQAEHNPTASDLGLDNLQIFSSLGDLEGINPNRLSEQTVKCLSLIFLKLKKQSLSSELNMPSTLSPKWKSTDQNNDDFRDPYGVGINSGKRDIGPYKHFHDITVTSIDISQMQHSSFLLQRLKVFIEKLSTVDLRGTTHQQKLAFWINVYNVCMMNAFLEHGIPLIPQMMIGLMQKALINIGGNLLNALTIEHVILRVPSLCKDACPKTEKRDKEVTMRGVYGLEWPEPMVTFALACGSRSSPAVRVYTAENVLTELEAAKKEYLQVAIGVSSRKKVFIPKLLDWYSRDFAKDLDSLLRWISLQLPRPLQNLVMECLELVKIGAISQIVEVMPYDFDFRYIFAEETSKLVIPS